MKLVKKYYQILIVLGFCGCLCLPFLIAYIKGDDSFFHFVNILSYSKTSIFSKIIPFGNKGFGLATGIFYPCLPHIIGALGVKIANLFGHINAYVFGIKFVKVITIFLSGISMYLTAKIVYNNKLKGMLASLFYLSSSYFFVDIFMRDALNESFIFIFVPLIFLGLYYLFEKKNYKLFYICFITGYVGIIYSHIVMGIFFTILLIPLLLIYIKKIFTKENLKHLIIASVIILIITSTFTILLAEHMHSDLWNLPFKSSWVFPFYTYLIEYNYKSSESNLLFVNFNYIVILCFIISTYHMLKKKNNNKFIIGIFLFAVFAFAFSTFKPFWNHAPEFFETIQFVWRLALFTTFGVSLFSVYAIDDILNIFKTKYLWIGVVIIIIILGNFTIYNFKKVHFYRHLDYHIQSFKDTVIVDYIPKKTLDNLDYFKERDNKEIIGNGLISVIRDDVPSLKFQVENVNNTTTLELPRLYYLGYEIKDQDGNKIAYYENEYGFIEINVPNGVYTVKYTGTKLYQIAVVLKSILIVILLYISFIWTKDYLKRKVS